MNDDDLASPPPLAATSCPLGSDEYPLDPILLRRGTQALVRLEERHSAPDQKTGTPRRSQVPCSVVYALPWSRRSGTIRTKSLRLSWRFSHRPLSDLLLRSVPMTTSASWAVAYYVTPRPGISARKDLN